MLALYGTGVSSGIYMGQAYVLYRDQPDVPEYVLPARLTEDEVQRFTHAIDATRHQLEEIREHIPSGAPTETASFIDAHLLILNDSMVSKAPIETIRNKQCNAEWALKQQCDSLEAMFDDLDDSYIRNRKIDVIQVVQGTYNGNFTYNSNNPNLGYNITLEGGYTSECATRVTDPANTVLDGGSADAVLRLLNNVGGDIVIEGFTTLARTRRVTPRGKETWREFWLQMTLPSCVR